MSEHLMVLLQRINAKAEEVKPVEKPPESPYLMKLIGRIEAKKWRDEMLQKTLERLCWLQEELETARLIQKDETLQFELSLDVIRYGGSKSCLWYLRLLDGDFLPEVFLDCPRAENYDMGSYFTGENHKEAIRFIVDRAKWAEPIIEEELYTAIDFYLALESWDLESPLPPFTSNEELFNWGLL